MIVVANLGAVVHHGLVAVATERVAVAARPGISFGLVKKKRLRI